MKDTYTNQNVCLAPWFSPNPTIGASNITIPGPNTSPDPETPLPGLHTSAADTTTPAPAPSTPTLSTPGLNTAAGPAPTIPGLNTSAGPVPATRRSLGVLVQAPRTVTTGDANDVMVGSHFEVLRVAAGWSMPPPPPPLARPPPLKILRAYFRWL